MIQGISLRPVPLHLLALAREHGVRTREAIEKEPVEGAKPHVGTLDAVWVPRT